MFYYQLTDGTWNDGDSDDGTAGTGSALTCEWG